jgi:PadR family transcriptional regulator, regulatory protein PadR
MAEEIVIRTPRWMPGHSGITSQTTSISACRGSVVASGSLTTCRQATHNGGVELRPPSYFTLAALIDGPLHGYAIMRRAGELSEGSVRVSTGTLYSIIERALAEGLVVAGDTYVVSGRERRDYALTTAGRAVLQQESDRLARAARIVGVRLKATGVLAT